MKQNLTNIKSLTYRMGKNMTLSESEKYTGNLRNNDIIYKYYYKNTCEWETYIGKAKNDIYEFLNVAYLKSTGTKFLTYDSGQEIYDRVSLIKIAFNNNDWVAIALYTNYRGGNKCIGIAKNYFDPSLSNLGSIAVRHIIREDIGNYEKFYWAEVSGKLVQIFEENDGIKIPSIYAERMLATSIQIIDDYWYERIIKDTIQQKIIFGFNTLKTFKKIYIDRKEYIDDCIERIKRSRGLNEGALKMDIGINELNEWGFHMDVVRFFIKEWNNGYHEYPLESITHLQTSVDYLNKILISGRLPKDYGPDIKETLENGRELLKLITTFEINDINNLA